MSILGWRSSYTQPKRARTQNPEQVVHGGSDQELIEPRPQLGDDPAVELRKAFNAPEKYLSRMAVRVGDKIVLISLNDVLWIQSHGNLVRLHLQNASYEHRTTITKTYTHLDPERFVRVHRSAIVNLDHVTEFDLPRCGNAFVHLRNGKALPISRAARQVLRRGLLSQSYGATGFKDI